MSQEFTWGEPACGLAVGLAVSSGTRPLRYRMAIRNCEATRRELTVFATLDSKIRVRLIACQGDQRREVGALLPEIPVTARWEMVETMSPGQVLIFDGAEAVLRGLGGRVSLQLVFGGVAAHPCAAVSGVVEIDLKE